MPAPAIHVDTLRYTYAGARTPSVRDISFDVAPGEIFGFLGPSGAGKSTTQKLITGLLKGYAGEAQVLGTPVRDWRPDDYARIGVGFELPNHYLKLTARENLDYFRALYPGACLDPRELLAEVGLADDADTPVGAFSKGMRMRLNFCRALLHQPELLFLDEPTSGLDPVNGRRIKDLILARRAAGCTVFLTTHNMTDADELCDRVAFMVAGELPLIDAPRALKLRHGKRAVRVEYGADGPGQARDFPLDGLGENEDFLALLRNESIQTIHSEETTLERIFIEVTGATLR